MTVQDFEETVAITDPDKLRTFLSRRYNGFNDFTLSGDNENGPYISILARDQLAYVHYFPPGDHPGYMSIGDLDSLDPDGMTSFRLGTVLQEQEVVNYAVVHFEDAVMAAKQFFETRELPTAIRWEEL